MSTKRELEAENESLRQKFEEVYDVVGDALGFEDESEDDDGESDASDDDDEKSALMM